MTYRTATLVLIAVGGAWFGWWGHRSGAPLMFPWAGAQARGDSIRAEPSMAGAKPVPAADSALAQRRR